MKFNNLHWLNIAEYISIVILIISLIIFLISGNFLCIIIALSLALLINLIQRSRLEKRSKGQIAAIKKTQKKLAENIKQKSTPAETLMTNTDLSSMREYLIGLESSLKSVIEYLNTHSLDKKVDFLQEQLTQLQTKIALDDNQSKHFSKTKETNVVLNKVTSKLTHWKYLKTLKSHEEAVTSLSISCDAKLLASVSWDKSTKLWDLTTGNLLDSKIEHSQGLLAVSFTGDSLNNYRIATGGFDHCIKVWSIKENNLLHVESTLTNHSGSIHDLVIIHNRLILLSGSYDQTIKQWDLETGKKLTSSYDELGAIYALASSEEKELVASAGPDGNINIWHLGTGQKLGYLSGNILSIESMDMSRDGKTIAAGCFNGTLKIWHLPQNAPIKNINPTWIIPAHSAQIKSVVFNPDGQTLFTSGADGRILLIDSQTGQQLGILESSDNPTKRIFSLALSPDGNLLAAGSVEGDIRIWIHED